MSEGHRAHALLRVPLPGLAEVRRDFASWQRRSDALRVLVERAAVSDPREFRFVARAGTSEPAPCEHEGCAGEAAGYYENCDDQRWCAEHFHESTRLKAVAVEHRAEGAERRLARALRSAEWYRVASSGTSTVWCSSRSCRTPHDERRVGAVWWFLRGCGRRVAACDGCWAAAAQGDDVSVTLVASLTRAVGASLER